MTRWRYAWGETKEVICSAWSVDQKRRSNYAPWRRPFELVISVVAYTVMIVVFGVFIFGVAAATWDGR